MSDTNLTLASGAYARILVEQRCAECGTWLTGGDLGHSSLSRLSAGLNICTGKGAGRKRTRIFTAMPTEKQRAQVAANYDDHPEYHPLLRWRTATVLERHEIRSRATLT